MRQEVLEIDPDIVKFVETPTEIVWMQAAK